MLVLAMNLSFLFFFATSNKDLLYNTGNYSQYLVITYNEK